MTCRQSLRTGIFESAQDDKGLPKKIVVSVKAGENVGVAMIRDFAHVIDQLRL